MPYDHKHVVGVYDPEFLLRTISQGEDIITSVEQRFLSVRALISPFSPISSITLKIGLALGLVLAAVLNFVSHPSKSEMCVVNQNRFLLRDLSAAIPKMKYYHLGVNGLYHPQRADENSRLGTMK